MSDPKPEAFHFDCNVLLILAEHMTSLLRTEMPAVMPKKEQAEALALAISILTSSPAFLALNMVPPTAAIVLAMCKTIVDVADAYAALPDSATDRQLKAAAHPSKFLLMKKFYKESKRDVPLPQALPDQFADPMMPMLVTIHDEVNRPSKGKHDRTQFEINADETVAKETKHKKGTDALALSNSSSSKTKGKGKEKKPKQSRAPAPVPPSIGTNSSVGAGSFGGNSQFSLNTILALLAGNSGSSSSSSSSSSSTQINPEQLAQMKMLLQQHEAMANQQQAASAVNAKKRKAAAKAKTLPSQRQRTPGSSLNDVSYSTSLGEEDEEVDLSSVFDEDDDDDDDDE